MSSYLYESSVGKKVLMAVTGVVFFGFVIVHMVGNLKIYTGEAHFNDYAIFLRTVGDPAVPYEGVLWIFRVVLLACLGVHLTCALLVYLQSKRARKHGYYKKSDLSFAYASRTMRWGGVTILAFVVFHILHLTLGTVHPDFVGANHPQAYEHHVNAYRNVIAGFRVWPVSVVYILAMIPLGWHIYHGLWSATQTVGLQYEIVVRCRRPLAAAVALLIVLGNISIPLSVLAGWIR